MHYFVPVFIFGVVGVLCFFYVDEEFEKAVHDIVLEILGEEFR